VTIVYVLVGLAALIAVYFLFLRKPEQEQLAAAPKKPELPEKKAREPEAKPKAKAEAPAEKKAPAAEAPKKKEPEPEPEIPVDEEAPAVESRPALSHERDVAGLRRGLAKSRGDEGFFGKLKALITGKKEISADIAGEIEEILLQSDVGVATTQARR
jgi:fused signal recognition particle receptor